MIQFCIFHIFKASTLGQIYWNSYRLHQCECLCSQNQCSINLTHLSFLFNFLGKYLLQEGLRLVPLFQDNSLSLSNNIIILRISQTSLFQAQGAFILKGNFLNYEGFNLRSLIISSESYLLEDFKSK